jgi:excisionase family DNA binding protein
MPRPADQNSHIVPHQNHEADLELLTVKEVADLLRCSPATVRRLDRRGHLPAVKIQGSAIVRYQRQDVVALVVRRSGA